MSFCENKSMNIWILNHYAETPDRQATRAYDLGRELVLIGHTVTIFASSFSHYRRCEEQSYTQAPWKTEVRDGVRFVWLKTFPYTGNGWRRGINMLSYAWRAFWAGRNAPEKPDVIIGTCVHPFAPLAAYLLSLLKGSRFVYELTDIWPEVLIEMGAMSARSPVTWALRILAKFLYGKAKAVITLLPHAGEYLTALGVSKEKVVWIPNGVDLSRYQEIKLYDGGDPKNFTIMYLGGHAKYHGLETVLEAADLLRGKGQMGVRFLFVGDGPEKPFLVHRAHEMGLENVEFHDLVPKHEIARAMSQADAFVFCFRPLSVHKYGLSPVKLFDYLASGRPTLFTSNIRENLVEAARAGLTVPQQDPEALVRAIESLLAMEPEDRIQMGRNGQEYVRTHHDTRLLAKTLEQALRVA